MKVTVFLFACILFFFQCDKEEDCCLPIPDDRSLIFGTYFGHCVGDCAQLFKIDQGEIFPDEGVDRIIENEALIFGAALPMKDYDSAKFLLENFPGDLLNEEVNILGIPDAYDQGGIYLELVQGDSSRVWYLDSNISALPEYLQGYATDVLKTTELLRNE